MTETVTPPAGFARVCRECGNQVPQGYDFCVVCGAKYAEQFVPAQAEMCQQSGCGVQNIPNERIKEMQELMMVRIHGITRVMLWIWIVLSLVSASVFLLLPDTMIKMCTDYGLISATASEAVAEKYVLVEGTVLLASGIMALVSVLLCTVRKAWKVATATCAVSAIIPSFLMMVGDTSGVFLTLAGFVVTLRLLQSRSVFAKDK